MAETSQQNHDSGRGPSSLLIWMEPFVLRHRLTFNILFHAFIFALSLLLSYLLWFDAGAKEHEHDWFANSYLYCLPFFLVLKLAIFGRMKLFRGGWQYSGLRDVTSILLACWYFVAIAFILVMVFKYVPAWMNLSRRDPNILTLYFEKFPRGVLVLDFLASVFLVCTARLGIRLYREELRPISAEGVRRVLVVGAGNAAEAIVREINRMRVERYRVVGLVDDDPTKQGILIHGCPVLGKTPDIRLICQEKKVEEIIIAMPSATQKQLRRVIEFCGGTKLKFQSLPGVGDIIDGRVTVSQIRPVDINDLLGRAEVNLDARAVASFIRGRRVLITGAGGSIGSEMCRQVCRFEPAALILVEQAETPLFDIENELRASFPAIRVEARICDIYDQQRVTDIWETHRPDVVIHAAAHKHVPLMERDPSEAIKNNVLGTRNVADACCRHGVAEMVLISTDKAVNPSSVMGASKRIAEIYTQALNGRPGCKTNFKAVRFGNVLGSAGSVIPIFRRQIAQGGPVTVTHPDMTRYFMTIPEASQLVLQAAATGAVGQIFLLDMGEPVKIVDLARQMITLSGFRPGEDIDIVFTGVRPGEKLFEELRTVGEDIEPTMHPKVLIWKHRPTRWEDIQREMDELAALQNSSDRRKIIDAIRELVPEYCPPQSPDESPAGRAVAEAGPGAASGAAAAQAGAPQAGS